ncbi:MAG TPA: M23 family metallopeptidase [Gammaproteobacteria bacterium]|nr:M23 family metallopeptidase [Gammaproteobacteria bacterium]
MEFIVVRSGRASWRWNLRSRYGAAGVAAVMVLVVAGMALGYVIGTQRAPSQLMARARHLQNQIKQQKQAIADIRTQNRGAINAVAARMAQLNAQVNRLDAMGAEIVHLAGLKKSGFNFSAPAGEGGPVNNNEKPWQVGNLNAATSSLSQRLWHEEHQLTALEALLTHKRLSAQIVPRGKPVRGGWISSPYGWRTDPFTGEREFHYGIDFAGHEGAKVHAVAAGVVTWAGPRYGYGNLVIINDGDGYMTYYAHNKKVLVKVGQIVRRGDVISLMGETGRATGPHVHLEVHKDGVPINPWKFVEGKGVA